MDTNTLYRFRKPLSLTNGDLMLDETLFHNANGYLGVRSNFEEGYPEGFVSIRGTYINGFYDFIGMPQAEKLCGMPEEKQTMLNVADTQGIELMVDGEPFNLFDGQLLEGSRMVDMAEGTTTREALWRSPGGKVLRVSVTRMASFCRLPLFVTEYTVVPEQDCSLTFRSTHVGDVMNYSDASDPRMAAESAPLLAPRDAELVDGLYSLIRSDTLSSGLSVVSAVGHWLSEPAVPVLSTRGCRAIYRTAAIAGAGQAVTLRKYTVLCDSIRYRRCQESALEILQQAMAEPVETLYREQREYLEHYWHNCAVHIDAGDGELEQSVLYNLYQLVQSAGKDRYSNIAAKGLSGEGYEGHYFWDTEMYLLPYFSLTQPDLARSLLEYRFQILDRAREHARIMGHTRGALYPWRTIMGKECSGYFPSGSAQYHINGDIAYAVIQYYLLTGDMDFIAACGAEMVFETARLWLDVGSYYEDSFRINDVTGPDEYTCIVNNNYYTNAVARYNLEWAVKLHRLLGRAGALEPVANRLGLTRQEILSFGEAAEKMYLPVDAALGVNPQDDSFLAKPVWDLPGTPKGKFPLLLHYHPLYLYRHQVCKQADTVLAHFILEDYQDLQTMRRSFLYYEPLTTHDSSLSTCIFSIMASRLGLREKALGYFGESYKLDLHNTHKNTPAGIHTANMGGTYMTIVYGFGGLRVKESGLHLAPVLPQGWNSYRFRVHYRGSRLEVEAGAGECRARLAEGPPQELIIYGEPHRLEGELTLPLRDDWGKEA